MLIEISPYKEERKMEYSSTPLLNSLEIPSPLWEKN